MGGNAMKMNKKGFTLIELLIVVAIIAILAAIAIPQFAAYRMRGYNAAGNSDVRNAKTAEEALFADFQTYGKTQGPDTLGNATNSTGAGGLLQGPQVSATATVTGGMVSGPRTGDGNAVATGVSLSNGVAMRATNAAAVAPAVSSSSYVMATKHVQGDRVFAAETESTSILYVQNGGWAGFDISNAAVATAYAFSATATNAIDLTGNGGGSPITNWSAL